MIQKIVYLASLVVLLFLAGCSEKNVSEIEPLSPIDLDTISLGNSMKGWKLYSWPNGTDWNYSLLVGTNILKTYEAVTLNRLAVTGIDSLKRLLEHLPEEEEIFWIGEEWLSRAWDDHKDLRLPPEAIVSEIERYCLELGLMLKVDD